MVDESRHDDTSTGAGAGALAVSSTDASKRYPKGVILGKDGKPCRSCNSFADFTSQTKNITKIAATPAGPPANCPPDVEQLGRSSWTLLHSITASYPEVPTRGEQNNVKQFIGLFSKLYPCWVCAEDFQDYMKTNSIRTESRDSFGRWMCEAHNEVNKKLGKKEFDCNKWEERWRTGWQDGRCD